MAGQATGGNVLSPGTGHTTPVVPPAAVEEAPARERVETGGRSKLLPTLGKHAALWAVSLLFILPMFWMLTTSLKVPEQVVQVPIQWLPNPVFWTNYPNAFFRDPNQPLLVYLWNTVWVAFWSVIGALISNTLVAYGFSRLRWPGRDAVFMLVIATLLIPFAVTMIPLYLLWNAWGQTNTYCPLIIPAWL